MTYLYNGVELPKLPEWDKSKYPYAFIVGQVGSTTGITKYNFVVCANPLTHIKVPIFAYYAVSVYGDGGEFNLEGSEWKPWSMDELLSHYYKADEIAFLWSNHDILNEDGSIYLADSCPIDAETGEKIHDYCLHPTTDPIDHASFLQGWLVGRRLAGMRK